MAVNKAELAYFKRQILVRARLHFVNEHTARTVHRLNGKVVFVDNGCVHVILIMVPMSRGFPKLAVKHNRGAYLKVIFAGVKLAPVVDKRVFNNHTLGQEEGEAGALLHKRKKTKLLAQTAVVTLFSLFNSGKIFL